MSDNKKLQLKQYKQLIYDRIRKLYGKEEPEPEREYKKAMSSQHRSNDIMRDKSNEIRSSYQKTRGSTSGAKKGPTHTSYSYHSLNSSLNDEEREELRKKQSLKDILKNKRERAWNKMQKSDSKIDRFEHKYDSCHQPAKEHQPREKGGYGTSPMLVKYYKHTPSHNNFFK